VFVTEFLETAKKKKKKEKKAKQALEALPAAEVAQKQEQANTIVHAMKRREDEKKAEPPAPVAAEGTAAPSAAAEATVGAGDATAAPAGRRDRLRKNFVQTHVADAKSAWQPRYAVNILTLGNPHATFDELFGGAEVGKKAGLYRWAIENFDPVLLKPDDVVFREADAYERARERQREGLAC
jgi:hypothetical protein